jgi:hypothetical protein
MDKVYVVYRHVAFQGAELVRVCGTLERAKEVAAELQAKEDIIPEHDDWGLCFGAEFIVGEWSVE